MFIIIKSSCSLLLTSVVLSGLMPYRCADFAIYDGHGRRLAAEYAQKHLHKNALAAGLPRELLDVKFAKKAMLNGIQVLSLQFKKQRICMLSLITNFRGSLSLITNFRGSTIKMMKTTKCNHMFVV